MMITTWFSLVKDDCMIIRRCICWLYDDATDDENLVAKFQPIRDEDEPLVRSCQILKILKYQYQISKSINKISILNIKKY